MYKKTCSCLQCLKCGDICVRATLKMMSQRPHLYALCICVMYNILAKTAL